MIEDLKLGPAYDGFLFLAEAARNPPVLRPHRHVELELNLVVRGSITYVVGGRRFTFPRGTLLWMFPAQEHQLVDRTGDAQYYVAVFKPAVIAVAGRSAGYEGLKRETVDGEGVLHAELAPPAFEMVKRMMDAMMTDAIDADVLNREAGYGVGSDFTFRHGDPDRLNAGLRYLVMEAWRTFRAGRVAEAATALHPAVRRALELLGEEPEEGGEGGRGLARRCGVSEAYLSRMFRRQVGVPLSRYRNSVRLGRFWEHHRGRPGGTLAEAVFAAGFGSYAQFHKVFTEAYGQGPRAVLGGAAK